MYEKIIKDKNISVTKPRRALLEALDRLSKPVTIETLKDSLGMAMDTSTIYRSLKVLVNAGIVYQTDFHDGVSYFEFQGNNHHHHITCTSCKKQVSIDFCPNKNFSHLEKKTGYTITNHTFEFFGLCEICLE